MPYKYRRSPIKRAKRPYRKYVGLKPTIPVKVAQVKYQVNRINRRLAIDQEYHTHDMELDSIAIDNSANQITNLSNIAEGDTFATRSGRKIVATNLSIRALLSKHGSATLTAVRVIVLLDKAALGLDASNYLNATTDVTSFRSVGANVGRYKVLYDRLHLLDANRLFKEIKLNVNWKEGLPIHYVDSTAADPIKNSLQLMYLSNEATNTPTLEGWSRLRFKP